MNKIQSDIVGITITARHAQMERNIRDNALLLRLMQDRPAPPPPTWLQRIRQAIRDQVMRTKDAWRVFRGDAYIVDD